MSGGSLDYVYHRIDDAIDQIKHRSDEPLHLAFAKHLEDVSKAIHDIEWVFSGDYGEGDEIDSIKKCLSNPKEKSIEAIRVQAEMLIEKLERIKQL